MHAQVEQYRRRLQHSIRLEEAAQEEQVLSKLRKWNPMELERAGLAVSGLFAQPSGELFGEKVLCECQLTESLLVCRLLARLPLTRYHPSPRDPPYLPRPKP